MDVLINKTTKQYDRLSRYSVFPYYYNTLDNKYIYGTTSHLSGETSYKLYQIQQGDTLDKLALDNYGNPTYYWIICDFNRIQDPFMDLPVGKYILIPFLSTIQFE